MPVVTSFAEANAILKSFVPKKANSHPYDLSLMRELMAFLGDPQNDLKIIHIAGTSGKTSTSYYVASLLQTAGKKVGLTVSPHVSEVNERLQINLVPLPEAEFCATLSDFLELIKSSQLQPSYFELLIALAFWEFARQKVDYAVIEVGLGGLLDGTNIIDRPDKLCVITDIGLDHIDRLGNTLAEIAAQKAGIIQNHNAVFCYDQGSVITDVFKQRVAEQHADLHIIQGPSLDQDFAALPLFQRRNFNLAAVVVAYLLQRDGQRGLDHQQLVRAAQVLIPARLEIFQTQAKTIVLDGAHNAQKLHALIESLQFKFPGQKIATLVSFVDGRSYRLENSLQELRQLTDNLIITTFNSREDLPHGAVELERLATLARQSGFATIETMSSPDQALQELLTRPEPLLLITGSFYLINDVRPLVQEL